MIRSRRRWTHLLGGLDHDVQARPAQFGRLDLLTLGVLWAFSIITIAASTMAPIAMAIPPKLMMLLVSRIERIATMAIRIARGSVIDRNQRAAHMEQEYQADQTDDDILRRACY